MTRVLLAMPVHQALAEAMAPGLRARVGRMEWRRFPDGESLVAIDDEIAGADVALLASLHHPDEIALALRFAAATAREFGARTVGLIAPYLAYMRQDTRFHRGEAISAPIFARFLEDSFDWLVTVDPHLHRNPDLATLYRIPARRVSAAPRVAQWIGEHVPDAVLIGPDSESEQWVRDIALRAGAPFQVLSKVRHGDRDVEVSLPDASAASGRTPVIVDDIVSSGRTMIETLGHLRRLGLPPAICIAIHAVFSGEAHEQLLAGGASRVVSTDTIPHPSNAISLAVLLTEAADALFGRKPGSEDASVPALRLESLLDSEKLAAVERRGDPNVLWRDADT